jgi:hypothetical protein
LIGAAAARYPGGMKTMADKQAAAAEREPRFLRLELALSCLLHQSPYEWIVNHHRRLIAIKAGRYDPRCTYAYAAADFADVDAWFVAWCNATIGGVPQLNVDRFVLTDPLMTGLIDCEFGGMAETVRFARPGDELVYLFEFTGSAMWPA